MVTVDYSKRFFTVEPNSEKVESFFLMDDCQAVAVLFENQDVRLFKAARVDIQKYAHFMLNDSIDDHINLALEILIGNLKNSSRLEATEYYEMTAFYNRKPVNIAEFIPAPSSGSVMELWV